MNAGLAPLQRSVVIYGLPGSGKTTYLAALWHLVTARDLPTTLRFDSLRDGDASHLNAIAARWRSAKVQDRTIVGTAHQVAMNLIGAGDARVRVSFPDVSGETYRRMWEDRECDPVVASVLKTGSVLLFVHADSIRAPQWIVDVATLSQQLGLPMVAGQEVQWHPRLAPTQVQLVGLLQLLRSGPLDSGRRRLAVMLSAWDKAEAEGLGPAAFLRAKMPLLHQYLDQAADEWTWRVYGVSAQGGEYEPNDTPVPPNERTEALRALDSASQRIRLVQSDHESHDLTEPLVWLME